MEMLYGFCSPPTGPIKLLQMVNPSNPGGHPPKGSLELGKGYESVKNRALWLSRSVGIWVAKLQVLKPPFLPAATEEARQPSPPKGFPGTDVPNALRL